jgi:hypothetical protein
MDTPDSNNAAATKVTAIGIAAVALVLSLLLSFIPLYEFFSSNVSDKEINHFHKLLQDQL